MAEHAKYSPSDSARWLNCEGAIAFCDTLNLVEAEVEEDIDTPSAQGTRAHELAQVCLEENRDPSELSDDEEMVRHIRSYISYVSDSSVGATKVVIEERLDISVLVPGMFGTSDVVIYDEINRRIQVIDLKYGQGVAVLAEENSQLMLYACGAVYNCAWPVEEIELTIFQPRVFDGLGSVRTTTITRSELRVFEKQVKASFEKQDSGVLTPGDKQCRWCPAAPVCPALKTFVLSKAAKEFEPFACKKAAEMDVDEIVDSMASVNLIKFWCNAVEAKAQELLEHGHKLPGYKLVRGRSNRTWVDEEAAAKTLLDMGINRGNLYTEKFVSPTKAELVMTKDQYIEVAGDLIYKPEGKLTIAKESDKRPSIDPLQIFKDID